MPVVADDRCARFRLQIPVEVLQLQLPHGGGRRCVMLRQVPGGASDLFIGKMFGFEEGLLAHFAAFFGLRPLGR